jgi:general nucleoside transport system ATP-binding protein
VAPIASFTAVTKVYPPSTVALDNVSVDIQAGAIHAFVGENGAGKSTLMKVLAGEILADGGELQVRGRAVRFASAAEAMAEGIGMVHQEILLVNELRVWENVVLGVEPMLRGVLGFGRIDRDLARTQVARSFDAYGLKLDADAMVGDLSLASRQKVEIGKLLHRGMEVLILDEPTAVLTPQEIPELFDELRRLRDAGRTICFISHHLDEVLDLCDTVTVLRHGRLIETRPVAQTTIAELARLMVERDVAFQAERVHQQPAGVVLDVRGLTWSQPGTAAALGPIDLTVRAGEIVGVAGVDGNGQTPLVECLTGARHPTGGTVTIAGSNCTNATILEHRRVMAYVPAERKTAGSAVDASITENIAMTHHRLTDRFTRDFGPLHAMDRGAMRSAADTIRSEFAVATPSVDLPMKSLSGGNQQKVILGRELLEDREFVILDQPTRGLDVGSIEFVHQRILQLRSEGRAVLLISADLDEIERLSDRVVVMHRGRVALDADSSTLDRVKIGRAMLEGTTRDAASKEIV